MRNLRTTGVRVAAVAALGLALSACATRGYVDEQIATVNSRMDGHESRIGQVEQRVADAAARADAANAAANAAAADARSANQRLDQVDARITAMQQPTSRGRTPRG